MTNNYKKIHHDSYEISVKVDVDALHAFLDNIADSLLTMGDDEWRDYGALKVRCTQNYIDDMDCDIRDRNANYEFYYGAVSWDVWYAPQFSWDEMHGEEEPTRPVSYYWEQSEPILYNGTLCLTLDELLKHAEDM